MKCILKDSKGYLWFGTNEGLNKFDGSNFTLFEEKINQPDNLINNGINALLEDSELNLWVGTGIGICIYNRAKDNFKAFKNLGKEKYPPISDLFEDNVGNIWIGTSGVGLYKYEKNSDSLFCFMPDANDPTSISSNFINTIIADNNGRIWVGTRTGLVFFDAENNSFHQSNNAGQKLPDDLISGIIKDLCLDKEGNLWIGTYGKGLYQIHDKAGNWSFNHFQCTGEKGSLSNNDILSLTCDDKGNLWIGTENGGLNVLPPNSGHFINYVKEDGNPQSISSNSIWSLYQDNTGIVWIGTYNHGVNFVDERIEKFEVYQRNHFETNTLVNNNVVNFTEDKSGTLWIATDGGGVSSFDLVSRNFTNKIDNSKISSKAVMAVLCDSRQRIWLGTWGGGIDLYEPSGRKIRNYKLEENNRPGNILSLFEDNKGNIWAGSGGSGLLLYNSENDTFLKVFDNTPGSPLSSRSYINVLLQDSENTLWVGLPNGLISINELDGKRIYKKYVRTDKPEDLSSSSITAIFEDSRQNLWIGTNDGLNLFNKEQQTFTVFRKETGLPNNTINGILEDDSHNLWISTYGGISKFDIEQATFKNYTKDDGMLSNSFNQRACWKTKSNKFIFGCNNGFVAFHPDSIKQNTYVPPVYFTGFMTFNTPAVIGAEGSPLSQSISETKQIDLNYKQTSFTIEFVALNFTHSARNQYAYMLEGFDEDWNYAGTKQFATYTNIDAGKYTFKVKGSNNEGIWNPQPIQLVINVHSPFWKTKWAYLFYFTCIVFVLWGFINLLIIKSNQAAKLRLEKIHHERSEELNRMKIQFFANISHEFRTPLSLILAPLKQIIENESMKSDIKNSLNMVYRNAKRLYGLVNELMDFTKSEEGRLKMMVQPADIVLFANEIYSLFIEEARQRNIQYKFESEIENPEVWFDKSKMEKIISNLISNAFKFTRDEGRIVLGINQEVIQNQMFAVISITDNGIGIPPEHLGKVFDRFFQSPDEDARHITGTGIGLALVKSLVEMHHGTVNVTSKKWEETCFSVKIPLGNAHFNKNEIIDDSAEYMPSNELNREDFNVEDRKGNGNEPLLLIVEDNAELREYLASALASGYKIIKASDGAEGISMAKDSVPDLIVSDIAMPRLSGIELCKIIKTEMSTSHIPVILLTSRASTPDVIKGIETGADAYITKPFDIQHLKITIEKTIETRRKLYQRFSQDVYLIPNESTDNVLERDFLENIIKYIDQNISDNNITVENLAAHMLMSRTNVYRKIKALTGQTATEFIRFIRLKMSIKLIESGRYNISEIAFKVGFSSSGYFAKCFKDQYGKSPSDFIVTKNKNS